MIFNLILSNIKILEIQKTYGIQFLVNTQNNNRNNIVINELIINHSREVPQLNEVVIHLIEELQVPQNVYMEHKECCVCYVDNFELTSCGHPICNNCDNNMQKIIELNQNIFPIIGYDHPNSIQVNFSNNKFKFDLKKMLANHSSQIISTENSFIKDYDISLFLNELPYINKKTPSMSLYDNYSNLIVNGNLMLTGLSILPTPNYFPFSSPSTINSISPLNYLNTQSFLPISSPATINTFSSSHSQPSYIHTISSSQMLLNSITSSSSLSNPINFVTLLMRGAITFISLYC